MGILHAQSVVENPLNHASEIVEALADTGTVFSMAPSSLLRRLGIGPVDTVTCQIANGETVDSLTSWALFSTEGRRGFDSY